MQFGESVALSPDGKFAVDPVTFQNTYSFYPGEYKQGVAYTKQQIVKYGINLYKAIQNIDPATGAISFSSFDSYIDIVAESDSTLINLLQTADYKINDSFGSIPCWIRAPIKCI